MGRLIRRFIRSHEVTVTNKLTVNRVQTIAVATIDSVINPILDIDDGVVVAGVVRSAYVQAFVGAGSQVGSFEGMRVNMYASATATITGGLSAIHVNNYIQVAPVARYCFLDLRENAAITVTSAICILIGAAADISNVLELPGAKTAWSLVANPPGGAVGRIAVLVGGVQRYLQLYS